MRGAAALLVGLAWIGGARAEEAPAAPSPQPAAPSEKPAPQKPHAILDVDVKLALSSTGIASNVPFLAAGLRYGRVIAQLGFGYGFQQLESSAGSSSPFTISTSTVTLAPTFGLDVFRAADRRFRVHLIGAPTVALALATNSNAKSGDSTSTTVSWGFQVAAGARMRLHPNFALGVEGGVAGRFMPAMMNGGTVGGATYITATIAAYGALVGSFTLGE